MIVLLGGDAITAIDRVVVQKASNLLVDIEPQTKVGQTVQLTIVREGETLTVLVTLGQVSIDHTDNPIPVLLQLRDHLEIPLKPFMIQ